MKCPICHGSKEGNTIDMIGDSYCNFCDGKKDLDWIENIFGVNKEYDVWWYPIEIKRGKKLAQKITMDLNYGKLKKFNKMVNYDFW